MEAPGFRYWLFQSLCLLLPLSTFRTCARSKSIHNRKGRLFESAHRDQVATR